MASYFIDTGVFLRVATSSRDYSEVCTAWFLEHLKDDLYTSAHVWVETYNNLTRRSRHIVSPGEAIRLINNYQTFVTTVALTAADTLAMLEGAARKKIAGGTVFEANHAHAARKSKARYLVTLNARHYAQIWPANRIVDLCLT